VKAFGGSAGATGVLCLHAVGAWCWERVVARWRLDPRVSKTSLVRVTPRPIEKAFRQSVASTTSIVWSFPG
jgi:hypothetical protein